MERLADLQTQQKRVHRRIMALRQHKLQKTQLRKPNIPKREQEHTLQSELVLDKYQIQIQKCELEQNVLFIPVQQGVYIPLIVASECLPANLLDNSETSRISNQSPACPNLFLDTDNLDYRYRSLVQYCHVYNRLGTVP